MASLKLLHVTPAFFPATHYGGPIFSTHALANALAHRTDIILRVLTTDAAGPVSTVDAQINPVVFPAGYEVYYAARIGRGTFSFELFCNLWKMVRWSDVIQLTGVYSSPTIPTLLFARLLKKPVVWSPRGSLLATEQWRAAPRRHFKWVWERVCRLVMPRKTILHVTSEAEKVASLKRLSHSYAAIVTNGAMVPDVLPAKIWRPNNELRLMFIGRLHPVKGIDNLLEALRSLDNVTLDIYGEGELSYVAKLREAASAIPNRISFHGHVDGAEKTVAFFNADICVLPSYSENFGVSVAEALAHGVPVIASTGTPWQSVETHGCGLFVSNSAECLAAAIQKMQLADLQGAGERGREFMKQQFSWTKKADELVSVMKFTASVNFGCTDFNHVHPPL
jgi:glycosyltransferase involved in cell wall biosynthesis